MTLRVLGFLRPLLIIALAVIVSFTMIRGRPTLEARAIDVPLPLVEVQLVQTGPVPVTVIAHGNVRAWRELGLAAQVTGRVIWQSPRFEPGVLVNKGEALLRIDPTDYRLALAEARQALASAELSLADAKALRQAARVDEAQTMVESARARIARAERDLSNTELVAPYSAVVDQQNVELGQYVAAGTVVGRVLGSERAEVRLPITPQDIGFIASDASHTVRISASIGPRQQHWEGRLARIEARIDEQTRVYPVVVEIDNPLDTAVHEEVLPFGLFVRAEIDGAPVPDSVLIPQAALHGDDGVFLLEDGRLSRRSVTVDRLSEGMALVSTGLADGERLVVTRLELMFDGMPVALIDG